eukprot:tig00001310_g8160.t1
MESNGLETIGGAIALVGAAVAGIIAVNRAPTQNSGAGSFKQTSGRCKKCKGTGYVICGDCEGQGRIAAGWNMKSDPRCSGTGRLTCPACGGAGSF